MKSSWQSCTGDAAPRIVNMHGVRVVYMYEEGAPGVLSPLNNLLRGGPEPLVPPPYSTPMPVGMRNVEEWHVNAVGKRLHINSVQTSRDISSSLAVKKTNMSSNEQSTWPSMNKRIRLCPKK